MSDARWGRTEEVIEEDMKECFDGWKEGNESFPHRLGFTRN